jgi:hypothetical protein
MRRAAATTSIVADSHQEPDRGVNFNVITDHGYLANPYRSIRYLDPGTPKGYSLGSQVYPDTRTSTAIQGEAKYFPALSGRHHRLLPVFSRYLEHRGQDLRARLHPPHQQCLDLGRAVALLHAESRRFLFSDLFPYADEYFEGRDQDLAAQDNYTIGAKMTYAFLPNGWKMFKRATVTFDASRITFHYSTSPNIKDYGLPQYQPGDEPLYQFNATVYQIYMSMFF